MSSQILLHGFSHGTTLEDEMVDKNQAILFIQNQQTQYEEPDNYIGFSLNKQSIIQFMRVASNEWILDIPEFDGESFIFSYQTRLPTRLVIDLVSLLFENSELLVTWKKYNTSSLLDILQKYYHVQFSEFKNQS
jgi:hypothetical protein